MLLYFIILGILQGIFEWIPISSEGVVALASQVFGMGINPIDMALFLHLGTLLAVIIYFRKDWADVVTARTPKLLKFLAIATIVSLVIGFPLYILVRNIAVGGFLLVVMGIGLLFTAYFHRTKKSLDLGLNRLAVVTGLLQGLAMIPGLSRSGSTIFGLSLSELSPTKILKISYMMSAPVILASTICVSLTSPILLTAWPALITSFIIGFLSLHILMKISQRINFYSFALIFAILCFIGAGMLFIV